MAEPTAPDSDVLERVIAEVAEGNYLRGAVANSDMSVFTNPPSAPNRFAAFRLAIRHPVDPASVPRLLGGGPYYPHIVWLDNRQGHLQAIARVETEETFGSFGSRQLWELYANWLTEGSPLFLLYVPLSEESRAREWAEGRAGVQVFTWWTDERGAVRFSDPT